ncbi:MAG: NUDIX hydrolase [Candidatus Portnoybacteria bacterium]|nr:NUDIX hydrolase [Candidatus Portnoybacteria bacterium]MDD5437606.1 NUDIX hydrolase [Patescibacteria group bacterium]
MPISPPTDSKLVFEGVRYKIFQAPRVQFDGSTKTFEYLIRPDSVTVFAFITPDEILLTEQLHPGSESFFDFPGGQVDKGETHEEAARRELVEETGFQAGTMIPIWRYGLKNSSRFEKTFFLATDLSEDGSRRGADCGEKIRVLREPIPKIIERCRKYELRQLDAMLCFLNLIQDPEIVRKFSKHQA